MFPLLNRGPDCHLFIVQPAYDPLMEYCIHAARALPRGRFQFCPEWEVAGDRARSRMGQCSQPGQHSRLHAEGLVLTDGGRLAPAYLDIWSSPRSQETGSSSASVVDAHPESQ